MSTRRADQRAGAGAGLSQQLLRDGPQEPARRGDPRPRAHRRQRLEEDRRGAVRFRAAPRVGAARQRRRRACWWSRARPRTSSALHALRGRGRRTGTARWTTRRWRAIRAPASRRSEKEGFRVLGIAWRQVAAGPSACRRQRRDGAGVRRASRPSSIRPRRAPARRWPRSPRAASPVKIVTGDSELVTQHVCAELKIPVTGVLTGKEIAQMDDHALARAGGNGKPVLPRQPGAEGPRHPRAQGARPRGRLSRRRHQRRAVAALGGCRPVGGLGRGRRQGGGRHDPARARPARAARRACWKAGAPSPTS